MHHTDNNNNNTNKQTAPVNPESATRPPACPPADFHHRFSFSQTPASTAQNFNKTGILMAQTLHATVHFYIHNFPWTVLA